jgi:hypothetical protein
MWGAKASLGAPTGNRQVSRLADSMLMTNHRRAAR